MSDAMLGLPLPQGSPAPALIAGDQTWSYGRLADELDRAGRVLGAAPQVGFVWCKNDLPSVVAYLAGLAAGHTVALFDAATAPEAAASLIDRYRPDWQVGANGHANPLYRAVDDPLLVGLCRRRTPDPMAPHPELGLLLPTSGTTGNARLVQLPRRAVIHNAHAIAIALALDPDQRAPTSLPLHYSYGLSVLNSHLVAGATTVLCDGSFVAASFWQTLRQHRCTSLAAVPYGHQMLRRLDLDGLNVPSLQVLTQAGGRLEPALVVELAERMRRRGGKLYVMYGQTEATARITVLPFEAVAERPGSVGLPLRDGQLAIADAAGESGEVVYRGPNVMFGYAEERADLAKGDQLGGVLHTGDLGYLDGDGYLTITGRLRRIAKVLGLRISLDDVEAMVGGDRPVAALDGGERLLVYCEGASDPSLAASRDTLAARLGIHTSMISMRSISSMPLTPNGKVDYARLARE